MAASPAKPPSANSSPAKSGKGKLNATYDDAFEAESETDSAGLDNDKEDPAWVADTPNVENGAYT